MYNVDYLAEDVKVVKNGEVNCLYSIVTKKESDREIVFDEDYGFQEKQLIVVLLDRLLSRAEAGEEGLIPAIDNLYNALAYLTDVSYTIIDPV